MAEEKIKVFVVDAVEVWRKILAKHINDSTDMEVVAEINSAQGAILMLEETKPDVVLLGASFNDRVHVNSIIENLRKIDAEVKIILCLDTLTKSEISQSLDHGINDFISKPYQKLTVQRSIRDCISGHTSK